MVAVPLVAEAAVTVNLIVLPADTVMPVKSWAKSGKYSYQAGVRYLRYRFTNFRKQTLVPSKETRPLAMVKSIPVWRIAVPQVSPSMPTQADAA